MEELYNELLEREEYLKSLQQNEQVKTRLSELTLVIVRVQQLLLPIVSLSLPDADNYEYLRGFVDGYGGEEPHDCFPNGLYDINDVWDRMCELKGNKADQNETRNGMNYDDLAEPMKFRIDMLAKMCHEVNKTFCESIGDYSQVHWEEAPEWQRESAKNGVVFHLYTPFTTEEDSHLSWMKEKEEAGWTYGEVKDPEKKEHPCMVPYNELPENQRRKDYFFKGVIDAYKKFGSDAHLAFDYDTIPSDIISKRDFDIKGDKTLRKTLDESLQNLKQLSGSRERSLAITKLQEAIMWLGMDLKRLNEANPYPDSYDASNTKIAPTADNLTL